MADAQLRDAELRELIDAASESLAVEYKEWLDLNDAVVRADIARHIAALANYGGGKLIFGLTDDGQYCGTNPFPTPKCNHDVIGGIVSRYLEPTFQCDVRIVRSSAGNDHPVVIVPPHGAAPICAKAGGPMKDGRSQGISQGVYYIRKPKPESAPITSAVEWAPVVRRCAMHDRSAILGALDAALRGAEGAPPSVIDQLKTWHDAAHTAFLRELGDKSREIQKYHWEYSYAIETANKQQLDANALPEVLRQTSEEVHDRVRSGWSMFYPFSRSEIEPYFNTDALSGKGERDFLECSLLRDPRRTYVGSDFWRVATDGYATLIRPYWEDDWSLSQGESPGRLFSPKLLAQMLAEFLRHAQAMVERFDSPLSISIRCEWHGISGREFSNLRAGGYWSPSPPARSDHRVVSNTWPVTSLPHNWPQMVAELSAPLIRVYRKDWVMTPEWVLSQAGTWKE